MGHSPSVRTSAKYTNVAALLLAVLCAWRLPVCFGLGADSVLFSSRGITVALAAGLYLLLRCGLTCRDRRLLYCAYGLGLAFSLMTVMGEQLKTNGEFLPFAWLSLLDGLFLWTLFALVYGSLLVMAARGMSRLADRADKTESLFDKISGNFFVVFALLLLCWLPALLACWPGSFRDDAVVQFYQYMDGSYAAHHPLLHTLFLGFLMMTGIDRDAEGSAATGLALYGVVQLVLMAAIVAWACHWLRRKRVPAGVRVGVTLFFALFPFYGLWSFNAVKDVLFAGFALLFVMNLIDLWQDGYALLRSPLRIIGFVLSALLMMLFRNNCIYALGLLLPFAVLWAKGARWRVAGLLAGCMAAYLLANAGLTAALEAESGSVVEALSIPLQQISRTLKADPDALTSEEDRALIDALYEGVSPSEYYYPASADPVKWAISYDLLEENLPRLLSLWARLGVTHSKPYAEAFLVQNLPYTLPGADTLFRLDLGLVSMDLYPLETSSYLPELYTLYQRYDDTQTFLGLPGVRLLSDTAFWVWVCLAGFVYGLYRRQRAFQAAFGFLLAYLCTCLMGPIAAMRYVVVLFYAAPVLLAAMLGKGEKGAELKKQIAALREKAK